MINLKHTNMKKLIVILSVFVALSCTKEVSKSPLPDSILVLGNSITIIPTPDNIIWWGEWGMAASARDSDFIHRIQTKIRTENPDCNITAKNIADWERSHVTFDKSAFDPFFIPIPDLVIIRLGENVTDETGFDDSIQSLIDYIQSKTSARIIVTGVYWEDDSKEKSLKDAAIKNGLTFTTLSELNIEVNHGKIGDMVYGDDGKDHIINHAGVALHPNDKGMKAIADKIFKVIQ